MDARLTCEECCNLLEAYGRTLMGYQKASSQLSGMISDDFKRMFALCEKLRQACQAASAEVLAHLNSHWEESLD